MPFPLLPVLGAVGGAILGATGNAIGQHGANVANAREAQRTRDFQANQRATQYQTAVEDMRKAGLNPALAYQQGGAGIAQGATAQQGSLIDTNGAMTSATAALATMANVAKTKAEANQISIESAARLTQIEETIKSLQANTRTTDDTRQGQKNVLDAQANNLGSQTARNRQDYEFNARSFQDRLDKIKRENGLLSASAKELESRTTLQGQELMSKWYKDKAAPWANNARHLMSVLPSLIKIGGR